MCAAVLREYARDGTLAPVGVLPDAAPVQEAGYAAPGRAFPNPPVSRCARAVHTATIPIPTKKRCPMSDPTNPSEVPTEPSARRAGLPTTHRLTRGSKWSLAAVASAVFVVGCYELTSVTTQMWSNPGWTGSGRWAGSGAHLATGLAGQDIYHFREGFSRTDVAPFLSQFGGEYELTGIAQTHSLGFHEHMFVHGNLVGETDNLRLLYGVVDYGPAMTWIEPLNPHFWEVGQDWEVVEICDLTAAETGEFGLPTDADSHLFMSVRACPTTIGSCAGGVLEVQIAPGGEVWWVRSTQEGYHATVRKPNGSLYSNECMPISVTARGDQTKQYLAVGDPDFDEISVFDAKRIFDGPLDSRRAYDSSHDIMDLVIEGRRDGTAEFGFLGVLWGSSGARRLEHTMLVDGAFPTGGPHLTETLAGDVDFIQTLGTGAEDSSAHLFTFGDRVQDRRYDQE